MISVYTDADYLAAYKQKSRIWKGYMLITAIYFAVTLSFLAYHISLPYADPKDSIPEIGIYTASVIYLIISFPYLAIKYSRAKRYYNLITDINEGLKTIETSYFYTFGENTTKEKKVENISCFFEVWNKKHKDWMEREAYFDVEQPTPPFECGDLVEYVTQSNFIIQYRIIERKALEFSAIEENETTPTILAVNTSQENI